MECHLLLSPRVSEEVEEVVDVSGEGSGTVWLSNDGRFKSAPVDYRIGLLF